MITLAARWCHWDYCKNDDKSLQKKPEIRLQHHKVFEQTGLCFAAGSVRQWNFVAEF